MIPQNCSWEVLSAVKDTYDDESYESKELISEICRYLYYTTLDDKIKAGCVKILNDLNTCLECGSKMVSYNYKEYHSEVDGCEFENMNVNLCPCCDVGEMERLEYGRS